MNYAVRRSPTRMPLVVTTSDNLLVIEQYEDDPQIPAIKAAVEEVLSGPSLEGYSPIPAGVHLLSVRKRQNIIILDFSEDLLSNGTGAPLEDALHQILGEIGNLPGLSNSANSDSDTRSVEFQILVNGVRLEHYNVN